jgi:hypothetical protein
MSTGSLLLTAALLGANPAAANTESVRAAPAAKSEAARTRTRWRAAYADALRRSAARDAQFDTAVVTRLTDLYRGLEIVDELSHAERARMRRGLEARLERIHDRLLRRVARDERSSQSATQAGGGTVTDFQPLIDLIRSTIAPQTWTAGGGAVFPSGGGFGVAGGAGANAATQDLVDLIHETIEPLSWDVNGGAGSIGVFAQ